MCERKYLPKLGSCETNGVPYEKTGTVEYLERVIKQSPKEQQPALEIEKCEGFDWHRLTIRTDAVLFPNKTDVVVTKFMKVENGKIVTPFQKAEPDDDGWIAGAGKDRLTVKFIDTRSGEHAYPERTPFVEIGEGYVFCADALDEELIRKTYGYGPDLLDFAAVVPAGTPATRCERLTVCAERIKITDPKFFRLREKLKRNGEATD